MRPDPKSTRPIAPVIQKQGLTRFEVKIDRLGIFPLHVVFKSPGVEKRTSNKERRMAGYTLNWFFEDYDGTQLTEKLPHQKPNLKPLPEA